MQVVGNLYAVVLVLAVIVGIEAAEDLDGLASRLGASDSRLLDGLAGWSPIGGSLLLAAVIALRTRRGPLGLAEKGAYAALALPLVALAATFFYTPGIEDRGAHLAALEAGGPGFRIAVVATQWAVLATVVGVLVLALAQIASPRWQPGNPENEHRSHLAGAAAFGVPSVVALLVGFSA